MTAVRAGANRQRLNADQRVGKTVSLSTVALHFTAVIASMLANGCAAPAAPASSETAFYVAPPPSGNDLNPGTESRPFATMARARAAVREVNTNMESDIVVYLKSGDYEVSSTIELTEADSGTNGHFVVYKNYDAPGTAHLIGGRAITGWVAHAGNIVKAQLDPGWSFHTLFENGRRARKARHPNHVFDANYPTSRAPYLTADGVLGSHIALQYKPGDLDPSALLGGQVVIWSGVWSWFTDTVPIASVDATTRQITLSHQTRYPIHQNIPLATPSSRYFVQGALPLLDEPGEFHLEGPTLYYWPRDGAIDAQTIVAPMVKTVLSITGSAENSRAHHIRIEGLAIESSDFTAWYRQGWVNEGDSGEGHLFPQYDRQINMPQHRTGMVFLENTHDITIEDCHLKGSGYSAIYLLFANHRVNIRGNWLEHLGHSGIFIEGRYPGEGDVAVYNTITNNLIHDVGELVGNAAGVYLANAGKNQISNSEIFNSPRYAIGCYVYDGIPNDAAYAGGNTFSHLKLHDTCQDSDDTAAVMAFGLSSTAPYHSNSFEQITVTRARGHASVLGLAANGFYLDLGANNQQLSNVEVRDTAGSAFNTVNSTAHVLSNVSWEASFDPSLMDYANIGLAADFPSEYRR